MKIERKLANNRNEEKLNKTKENLKLKEIESSFLLPKHFSFNY